MEESGNNQIQNEQEEQNQRRHCLDILPFEMWKEILSKLKDGKFKALLSVRGVSVDLEVAAQGCLLRDAEKQFLKRQELSEDPGKYSYEDRLRYIDTFEFFLAKLNGTRFQRAEDIRLFISQMEGQQGGNPFPNGCVILSSPPPARDILPDKAKALHKSFEDLVSSSFSKRIISLFYDCSDIGSELDFLYLLSTIFKLRNLKNLYLCRRKYQNFDFDVLSTLVESGCVKFPQIPAIKQLFFHGLYSYEHDCSHIIVIFNQLKALKSTVTHLGFNWVYLEDGDGIPSANQKVRRFEPPPLLEYLEIGWPTSPLLERFCESTETHKAPRIKDLKVNLATKMYRDVRLPGYSSEESAVIRLFRILDKQQSQTLETLNFCFRFSEFTIIYLNYLSREKLPFDNEVNYPRLKHLQIEYTVVKKWRSLITQLKDKFPALEIFTVTASRMCCYDLSGKYIGRRAVYDVVSTLWEEFPDTSNLKEIRVPCLDWTLTRDGPLPLGVLPNIE